MSFITHYFPDSDYEKIWHAMQDFTHRRTPETPDELWVVEHLPVYTLGQNGDAANILQTQGIPVIKSDRGGQVTYHGPGQLVIYTLINLARYNLGVRRLVSVLENSVIQLLADFHIAAHARGDAPGVYINASKICSIGLRVRRGFAYHGLALNIDMDLAPFLTIHPCGHQNLQMTQLSDFGIKTTPFEVAPALITKISELINAHQ